MSPLDVVKKQTKSGIAPHAYLFYGTDNENKEKATQYLKNEFLENKSADFFEIIPEEGNISIEQIRFLKNLASRTSFGGKNIFLVRGLEFLTREAEVAMLKTLEDSSLNNLFIATTENFNLLHPTIKSRFCSLRFWDYKLGLGQHVTQTEFGSKEDLELLVRNLLLKWMTELRKTFSLKYIYKLEQLLKINQLLPITALNRRMVKEYMEMLDAY
ncbi:MAG TPA: hypothetical protein VJH05_02625 [Candidatus Paceibacterota bacterium]